MLAAADCPVVSSQAEELIDAHVAEARGHEYCSNRLVFNKGAVELVVYTIEGAYYKNRLAAVDTCGNNFFRAMIGVIHGKSFTPITVGGKGQFIDKSLTYSNGKVTLSGFSCKNTDAQCCPSQPGTKFFAVDASGFKELAQ